MPVKKFRRIEDMPQAEWRRPGDPALARAIATVWHVGKTVKPPKRVPGVHRKPQQP